MNKSEYNEGFYKKQVNESKDSAKRILPILLEKYKPKSVIDIGCGTGAWLNVLYEMNIKDILGIDFSMLKEDLLLIPKNKFLNLDINNLNFEKIKRKFDLAISLEVAEHLDIKKSEDFVKLLTQLSDVIIFSAAIPYQGGTNHKNENWPQYWISLFKKKGYQEVDLFREEIWDNPQVNFWYKQNIMLLIKKDKINLLRDIPKNKLVFKSYVHPELLLWICNRHKNKVEGTHIRDILYYQYIIKNYLKKAEYPKNKINAYDNTFGIKYKKKNIFRRWLQLI